MTTNLDRWFLGIPAALLLAQSAVMAGDRMTVRHSKQSTGWKAAWDTNTPSR